MTDTLEVYAPQFTPASSEEQYSVMTYMTTSLSGKKTEHCVSKETNSVNGTCRTARPCSGYPIFASMSA